MPDPADRPDTPTEWLAVLTTNNLAEAHIVAGRLESEGLHPRVHQEPGGSAFGITVGILGEIQVLVADTEFEAAQSLLREDAFVGEDDQIEPDDDNNE